MFLNWENALNVELNVLVEVWRYFQISMSLERNNPRILVLLRLNHQTQIGMLRKVQTHDSVFPGYGTGITCDTVYCILYRAYLIRN